MAGDWRPDDLCRQTLALLSGSVLRRVSLSEGWNWDTDVLLFKSDLL